MWLELAIGIVIGIAVAVTVSYLHQRKQNNQKDK